MHLVACMGEHVSVEESRCLVNLHLKSSGNKIIVQWRTILNCCTRQPVLIKQRATQDTSPWMDWITLAKLPQSKIYYNKQETHMYVILYKCRSFLLWRMLYVPCPSTRYLQWSWIGRQTQGEGCQTLPGWSSRQMPSPSSGPTPY